MKLTILAEDTIYRHGLLGEHGLSILIERKGEKWLFDTGQFGVSAHNAQRLGIDLREVSGIILSHGHYDHAAGVMGVLLASGPKPIFCHPDIFIKRYCAERGKGKRDINLPWSRKAIEKAGGSFIFNRSPRRISAGLVLSGEVPLPPGRGGAVDKSLRLMRGGRTIQDLVKDEQCLISEGKEGLIVILGCAHRGFINTVEYARRLCDGRKIHAVVGGAHLKGADRKKVKSVIGSLKRLNARKIAACHCTGPDAMAALRRAFPRRFIPCSTGVSIEL